MSSKRRRGVNEVTCPKSGFVQRDKRPQLGAQSCAHAESHPTRRHAFGHEETVLPDLQPFPILRPIERAAFFS